MTEVSILDVRADEVWPGDRLSEAELVLVIHLDLEAGEATHVRLDIARNGDDYLRWLMDRGEPGELPEVFSRELQPEEQLRVARVGRVGVTLASGTQGVLLPLWTDAEGEPVPSRQAQLGHTRLVVGGRGFLGGVFEPFTTLEP